MRAFTEDGRDFPSYSEIEGKPVDELILGRDRV